MASISRKPGRPRDEENAARREEEILAVAARVFAERGFRQTDVQVIADDLGIGKGTVYRYFPTKEALFLAAADLSMRRLREGIEAATEGLTDPLDLIRAATCAYLRYFDEHPQAIELLIQERAEFKDRKTPTYFVYRESGAERWRELFHELIRQGRVREMPVDQILDVTGNVMYGAIFTNHFAGRTKTLEVQATEILDVMLGGLLTKGPQDTAAGESA